MPGCSIGTWFCLYQAVTLLKRKMKRERERECSQGLRGQGYATQPPGAPGLLRMWQFRKDPRLIHQAAAGSHLPDGDPAASRVVDGAAFPCLPHSRAGLP